MSESLAWNKHKEFKNLEDRTSEICPRRMTTKEHSCTEREEHICRHYHRPCRWAIKDVGWLNTAQQIESRCDRSIWETPGHYMGSRRHRGCGSSWRWKAWGTCVPPGVNGQVTVTQISHSLQPVMFEYGIRKKLKIIQIAWINFLSLNICAGIKFERNENAYLY